jgi:hypothetical protein
MNELLQSEQVESSEEFREQKCRKRNHSDKQIIHQIKTAMTGGNVHDPCVRRQPDIPARNFFTPLRTEMEFKGSKEAKEGEQQGTNQAARLPPIILTSATILLQLQKQIIGIAQGQF